MISNDNFSDLLANEYNKKIGDCNVERKMADFRRSTVLKYLLICTISFIHQSASESYDIPLSQVRNPEDISKQLPPIDIPDAPAGFSWQGYAGAVNISTNILFPYEGQVVDNMFEVMLEIAAHPLGAFKERFEHAYQCVEVDSQPPACWAIFDNSPIPRLHLSDGDHELRSAVTDPTGEWILPMSWGPIRHIKIAVESVVPAGAEDEAESEETTEDLEPPVKMEIPLLRVTSPPEMGVITTRMVDMQFEVAIRAQADFEEHFKQGYVCGRLSHNVDAYCWSIYNTRAIPRWVGLDDGYYTLQASVTHPNTNEIITDSWGRVSSFLVLSGVSDLRLAGQGDNEGGKGMKPPSHIVLDINLRNDNEQLIEHKLPLQRGLDLEVVGKKFCRSRGVGNSECVDHIIREAEKRFKILDELERDYRRVMDEKAEKEATQTKKDAELLRRTIQVPEGDVLIVPDLEDPILEDYLFNAVETCELEYKQGGVGLECLTIQSELFGMRAKLKDLSKQEDLLDFIGNLGAGFGF